MKHCLLYIILVIVCFLATSCEDKHQSEQDNVKVADVKGKLKHLLNEPITLDFRKDGVLIDQEQKGQPVEYFLHKHGMPKELSLSYGPDFFKWKLVSIDDSELKLLLYKVFGDVKYNDVYIARMAWDIPIDQALQDELIVFFVAVGNNIISIFGYTWRSKWYPDMIE